MKDPKLEHLRATGIIKDYSYTQEYEDEELVITFPNGETLSIQSRTAFDKESSLAID
jgi:hypothetical protein